MLSRRSRFTNNCSVTMCLEKSILPDIYYIKKQVTYAVWRSGWKMKQQSQELGFSGRLRPVEIRLIRNLVDVIPREVVFRLGLLPRQTQGFPLMAQHTFRCMATWMVPMHSSDLRWCLGVQNHG